MSPRLQPSLRAPPGPWAEPPEPAAVADIASIRPRAGIEVRISSGPAASPRQRAKIWELHNSLHCSIIGTCLTTGELRRLLAKLNVAGAEAADNHDLHMLGVLLAGRPQAGAEHLQKALDRRHQTALNQFAKAKDAAAVRGLWKDAMARGDIPGAYWAQLTHPAATDAMVKRAFGEVHMLSHLVGAANRADIQRLRRLEDDNAALAAKLERQQRQLRDGFASRDETIRRLSEALARKAGEEVAGCGTGDDAGALNAALAERDRRLAQESARRERLERRLEALLAERDEAMRARQRGDAACEELRAELALAERQLGSLLGPHDEQSAATFDLHGVTVLYVGGRAHQAPQFRSIVERANGRFLHHDGGLEQSATLLPGLVSRADFAVFPVDCVSHDAVASLKRLCRQAGKRYLPPRTSSLACLLSGLAALQAERSASCASAPV
jgi:Uncharacterized protein conserved in bacteria (DUF2325)